MESKAGQLTVGKAMLALLVDWLAVWTPMAVALVSLKKQHVLFLSLASVTMVVTVGLWLMLTGSRSLGLALVGGTVVRDSGVLAPLFPTWVTVVSGGLLGALVGTYIRDARLVGETNNQASRAEGAAVAFSPRTGDDGRQARLSVQQTGRVTGATPSLPTRLGGNELRQDPLDEAERPSSTASTKVLDLGANSMNHPWQSANQHPGEKQGWSAPAAGGQWPNVGGAPGPNGPQASNAGGTHLPSSGSDPQASHAGGGVQGPNIGSGAQVPVVPQPQKGEAPWPAAPQGGAGSGQVPMHPAPIAAQGPVSSAPNKRSGFGFGKLRKRQTDDWQNAARGGAAPATGNNPDAQWSNAPRAGAHSNWEPGNQGGEPAPQPNPPAASISSFFGNKHQQGVTPTAEPSARPAAPEPGQSLFASPTPQGPTAGAPAGPSVPGAAPFSSGGQDRENPGAASGQSQSAAGFPASGQPTGEAFPGAQPSSEQHVAGGYVQPQVAGDFPPSGPASPQSPTHATFPASGLFSSSPHQAASPPESAVRPAAAYPEVAAPALSVQHMGSEASTASVADTVARVPGLEARRLVLTMPAGQQIVVDGMVIIGRRPTPPPGLTPQHLVAIPDETRTLSKLHVVLNWVNGVIHVRDLGSTNGTTVQTTYGVYKVDADGPGMDVEPGTVIWLGNHRIGTSLEA